MDEPAAEPVEVPNPPREDVHAAIRVTAAADLTTEEAEAVQEAYLRTQARQRAATRRTLALVAIVFLLLGLVLGILGSRAARPAPAPAASSTRPSSPPTSPWDDQKYSRMDDRVSALERQAKDQEKQLQELLGVAHLHTHRPGDQAVIAPRSPSSIELVPVPAPTNKANKPHPSTVF